MIDHTNLHIAIEVLEDVARDFPIMLKVNGYQDEIWNTFAKRVHYTIKNLQERYNELANESMDKMYKDLKAEEELREMSKE